MQLAERYDLRAADALQLAAALGWCENAPRELPFSPPIESLEKRPCSAGSTPRRSDRAINICSRETYKQNRASFILSDAHLMPYKPACLGAAADRNEFSAPQSPGVHKQHSSMARDYSPSNARTIPRRGENPDWQWCNNGEQNPWCPHSELLQTSSGPSSARDREDAAFVALLACPPSEDSGRDRVRLWEGLSHSAKKGPIRKSSYAYPMLIQSVLPGQLRPNSSASRR